MHILVKPVYDCDNMQIPLVGSARNEEPLVNAWVNWRWSKVFVGWDMGKLIRCNTA